MTWTEPIVLELRPAQPPKSLNALLGASKWPVASFIKTWRASACMAASRAGVAPLIGGQPAHVWLEVAFTQNRRRDEMSYVGALKAVTDGLVDAGCWPDDTRDFVVTWGCTWVKAPAGTPHRLIISPALPGTCVHTVAA
jgi:hypothetical protein